MTSRVQATLSRENFAALGAATIEDRATGFGGHASTETVVALATDNGRLECTFHDELFSSKRDAVDAITKPCKAIADRHVVATPTRVTKRRKSLEL
jgi:hypothetical protein